MSNLICSRTAPLAHASLFRLAALAACVGILSSPPTHAAEVTPVEATLSAPFNHYQRWRDEPLLDWRTANARVGEIGGWRTYLRESQQENGKATLSPHDQHGQ